MHGVSVFKDDLKKVGAGIALTFNKHIDGKKQELQGTNGDAQTKDADGYTRGSRDQAVNEDQAQGRHHVQEDSRGV